MRRTAAFDQRHPALARQAILLLSVLTYLIQPDDVVWRLVRNSPHARSLEHLCFGIASLLLGTGAWLRTSAAAANADSSATQSHLVTKLCLGDILCALAIASLLPLSGFLLLIVGESVRVYRLIRFAKRNHPAASIPITRNAAWRHAFRSQVGFWLAFIAMVIFSATLIDRLAEALFALAAFVGLLVYLFSGSRMQRDHVS